MHTIFPSDRLRKLRYGSNRRVVLGGLCDLADLFARQGASRHGMAAHEFRHRICTFLLCYFGAAVLCRLGLGNYFLVFLTITASKESRRECGVPVAK